MHLAEAAATSAGSLARESVPAEQVADDEWLILGTPGLVNGCAAGDRVRVSVDDTFEVVDRGGNVAAHIYSSYPLPEDGLTDLRESFERLGGVVEWPATRRFAVVTVPVSVGFRSIEEPIERFVDLGAEVEWNFGNVYAEDGSPIGLVGVTPR